MNSPVSRIETLDHCIERWAAMISHCLATTLAGILLSAQNVFHAVRDLVGYGPQVWRRLQFKVRLSQPMMSKLEAIGRDSQLFRRKAHNLPASVGSPYGLAQKPPHETAGAIETDLRSKTRSQIMAIALSVRSQSMAKRRIECTVETRMPAIKAAEPDAWAAAPIAVTNIPRVETGFAQALPHVSGTIEQFIAMCIHPRQSLAVWNRPQASICQGPGRG